MLGARSFPLLRYAWASPATLVGLCVAAIACGLGARAHRRHGAVEVSGGRLPTVLGRLPAPLRFDAITLGHVIVGRDDPTLVAVRDHEHVHVRQYERWGGAFFVAYLGASLVLALRGRDPYRDNPFERGAFAATTMRSRGERERDREAHSPVMRSSPSESDEVSGERGLGPRERDGVRAHASVAEPPRVTAPGEGAGIRRPGVHDARAAGTRSRGSCAVPESPAKAENRLSLVIGRISTINWTDRSPAPQNRGIDAAGVRASARPPAASATTYRVPGIRRRGSLERRPT